MRKAILPALLVTACLLAAPWAANAQTASTAPVQASPQAPPAGADAHMTPLVWSSLSTQQQRMLAPVQGQWDKIRPARQHRLAEHALHWAALPPERQQQIRERLTRWAHMTPEQRRQLRENARAFRDLTPAERAKVHAAYERFRSLPPAQREVLRERWRAMPPAQRMRWATEHPGQPQPVPMHPQKGAHGHR